MLRITVELVPFGNEEQKKKIGSMVIANVGMNDDGTYNYDAVIAPDSHSNTPKLTNKIRHWDRANSVWELISMTVKSADDHEEETDTMKRLNERL